jgi:hypothetical protein
MSKTTMKAVVFKGKLDVRIEDRPIPKIIDPTDIIVKVRYSALCGRYVWGRYEALRPCSLNILANFTFFGVINPARLILSWSVYLLEQILKQIPT